MRLKQLMVTASFILFGFFASNGANAVVVDVSALAPDGTSLPFGPGTYTVAFIGTGQGGAYNAWNPWGGDGSYAVTGCNDTGTSCSHGWIDQVVINNTFYVLPVDYFSTPMQSLDAYQNALAGGGLVYAPVSQADNAYTPLLGPITFTLLATTMVTFRVFDDPSAYSDNVGGVSLSVIDPAATPLPDALPLFAAGLVGTVLLASCKKRKVSSTAAAA